MVAFLSRHAKNGGPQLAPGVPVRAGQLVFGKYRVEELLGCGASAVVVSARHVHLRTPVTLKILTAYTDEQLDAVKRQIGKARIASRLRGEHVARIVDIGTTEEGMPFIVTDRLEGHTLAAELERRGRIPPEEAIRWILQACEGLAEAHALGLVHGDLKLKNLFLAKDETEGAPRLRILDFGMASPIEATGDAGATAWFGMPSYLAPEQIRDPSHVDARADVWALGVILHHLVSGELPFTADTVSGVLVAVCFDAAPLLSDVPYELARLVHRCLEKDPADRPASVERLAAALGTFLGEEGERASERVRAAHAAAGEAPPLDADASGSIPPVSLPDPGDDDAAVAPAHRPREAERPTAPSRRVVARRRARTRGLAVAAVLGVSALVATAYVASPSSAAEVALLSDDGPIDAASTRAPFEPAPAIPHGDEAALPTPHDLPPVTPDHRSSSRHRSHSVRKPSLTRKSLAPARSGSTTRLPAGLPATREPVVRRSHGAPKRDHEERSPRRSHASPSLPAPRTDDSHLRSLFDERK